MKLKPILVEIEPPYKQYRPNVVYSDNTPIISPTNVLYDDTASIISLTNVVKFRVEDHNGTELGKSVDMKSAIGIFKERYPYSSDIDAKPFIYEI